jgi:hypothetical protein
MSSIPLDLERRCEQRWAARFSAARALQEQHRLESQQQHQQLTAPDTSKGKTRRVESAIADSSRDDHPGTRNGGKIAARNSPT